jgi:hypothetical protein
LLSLEICRFWISFICPKNFGRSALTTRRAWIQASSIDRFWQVVWLKFSILEMFLMIPLRSVRRAIHMRLFYSLFGILIDWLLKIDLWDYCLSWYSLFLSLHSAKTWFYAISESSMPILPFSSWSRFTLFRISLEAKAWPLSRGKRDLRHVSSPQNQCGKGYGIYCLVFACLFGSLTHPFRAMDSELILSNRTSA